MGVNLRDLFPLHDVPDGWYEGKRIAVDGNNVAWRYLTSIRGRDGAALRNKEGRTISHLIGMLGVVRSLRSEGAEPIIIWDGPVHPRKEATVAARRATREDAVRRAEAALAAGDTEAHHRLMRGTVWLDQPMIEDCSRLLETLGVAVARADHDGERYAAALCLEGHADAVATEDYDALVAGAPQVLRRVGGSAPALHHLTDLEGHGITKEQLRQVAILCGTDWHPGVKGFGAKTALKALQEYPDLRELFEEAEAGRASTRFHRLVAASDMDLHVFSELDAFVASLPAPDAPPRPRPSPDMAAATADEMGISHDRVLACFC